MVDVTNVTMSTMTVVPDAVMGWGIAILVFLIIIASLFMISKNWRIFLFGAVVTTILSVIGWIANSVGTDAGEGNYYPLKVFGVIVGFVSCSLLVGYILKRIGWIEKFEDKYMKRDEDEK